MLLALSFARSLTIGGCMQRIRAVLLGAAVFFMAAQQLPAQAQVKRQEAPKDTITRNNAFSFNKFNSETLKRIRDVAGRDTASKDTLLDTLFFVALQAKMKNNEVVRKSVDSLIKSMKDSGETEAEPEMSTWAKIGHAIYSDDEDWCKIPALTGYQAVQGDTLTKMGTFRAASFSIGLQLEKSVLLAWNKLFYGPRPERCQLFHHQRHEVTQCANQNRTALCKSCFD